MRQLIILAQQPTQLSDQNFNLEGWMLIGAGIAICLAIILLFFFNNLFTKRCIQEKEQIVKKTQYKKQPNTSIQKAELHKTQELEKARQLGEAQEAEKVVEHVQSVKNIGVQILGGIEINLIEVNDLSKSISFYLKNELVIGRNPEKSQVIIGDDSAVSSKHCKFYVFDDKVYLMDLGSTNGTFVNGKPIEYAVALNIGDKIAIGARKYHVRW